MSESKILVKSTGQDGSNVTFTTTQLTAITWSVIGMQSGQTVDATVYGYVNANTQVPLCRIVTSSDGYGIIDLGQDAAQYATIFVKINSLRTGTLYVSAERESLTGLPFWQKSERRYIGEWGSLRADGTNGLSARFISGSTVFVAMSDGIRWRPVGAFVALQPNASVTGTTNETTLSSVTIPAGLMGADGSVRVTAIFTFVGTAGIKTMRAKFGGTTFVNSGPANTTLSASIFRTISNLTASSQVAIPVTAAEGGAQASTTVVGSVDTSADQAIAITVQLASAADSATLNKLLIEVL